MKKYTIVSSNNLKLPEEELNVIKDLTLSQAMNQIKWKIKDYKMVLIKLQNDGTSI